jgi:signal transduction histidine kinase
MQKQLLRMALFHILRSAVEATPAGGKITVETFEDEDKAVLTVRDTGYGIAREDIDNIFNPYFSTKKHGFGMGLPLVKQIISEHLGRMEVESEAGKGSCFRMIFPVRWREQSIKV